MKQFSLLIILGILFLVSLNFISGISITNVETLPEEVAPGQVIDVMIEIKNIFEEDVYNLNVKLDLSGEIPFAPYQSSSEKFLDELEEGDKENFKFKLIVLPSTASGIYKIPVQINYENINGTMSSKQGLISLTINSEPEIKVSMLDSKVLIRGKQNTFSIKIINSGLADVKFLYLSVSDVSGIRFVSEKEQYIGDINSDDFDSVEFNAYVNEDASGMINLPVVLRFKDATNKEFIEMKNILLRTYSLKEAQNLGFAKKPNYTLYILISILILGYIVYRIRKKRKLRRNRLR